MADMFDIISIRTDIPASTSKEARAMPWLAKVEAGQFCIVRSAWNQDFLHELEQFPTGKHDDQIDAVSVLYEIIRKRQQLCVA